jgi:hypothetical protein
MRSGRAGLIASNQPGFIVFDLPQGYEKMSFVLGPLGDSYLHSDENNAILTIKADGKKIFDKVVHVYDAPQEVVLNIKGVRHKPKNLGLITGAPARQVPGIFQRKTIINKGWWC